MCMGGSRAPQYPISRSYSCQYNIKSEKCLTDIFCNFFRTLLLISIQFLRETCQFQYNFWERHVDFNTIFERDMLISIQFLRGTCQFQYNFLYGCVTLIQYTFWEGHVNFNTIFERDMLISIQFFIWMCQFQYTVWETCQFHYDFWEGYVNFNTASWSKANIKI